MQARAFLRGSNFIILDEATSSVDLDSENKINMAIQKKFKGNNVTIIVIAHRVSTIKNADNIIILDKGKVLDQGTPKELEYDDSWYSRMMELNN